MKAEKPTASDRKVLLFLLAQMKEQQTQVLESPGLVKLAVMQHVVNTGSSFSTCLARLRFFEYIEWVRSGRIILYSVTERGMIGAAEAWEELAEQEKGDDGDMNQGLEEQLKAAQVAGKLPTYQAPPGVALPREGTYPQDLAGILALFKDRINGNPSENENNRLKEWFEKLTANGQPAFYWMQEAIVKTSSKVKVDQRHLPYVIGILKSWAQYGYGTDLNVEQRRLFDRFEQQFGCTLSTEARQRLIALVDAHGIVATVSTIFQALKPEIDMSALFVDQMEKCLSASD